ncbi:MAG TPA: hypothetical protein VIT65_06135 [Microlunatus sp.]
MVTPEIIASCEKTLAAHIDGVSKTVRGADNVRKLLQTFFDSMGPNPHIGEAFYPGTTGRPSRC